MTYNEWIMELFRRYKQEQLLNRYGKQEPAIQLDCIAVIQKYLRMKGILEEQDVLFGNEQMEKRHLARIAHEFLKKELGELDEPGWEKVVQLKDLYDCRACVNHVAQMYAKGIMVESSYQIFGMRKRVSDLEARDVIERLFSKESRIPIQKEQQDLEKKQVEEKDYFSPFSQNKQQNRSLTHNLDAKAAKRIMEESNNCLFVDVNAGIDFLDTEFAKKAIHIPMAKILNAPQMIPRNPGENIILYCEKGYQSRIVKNALLDFGYENVYSFGLDGENVSDQK